MRPVTSGEFPPRVAGTASMTGDHAALSFPAVASTPVNGQRDFPVGGQVISPWADS